MMMMVTMVMGLDVRDVTIAGAGVRIT